MATGDRWIELSAGDQFAGYTVEQTLGRGGMGVLYLAIEPGLDRRVALKLIAPEAAADDVFARRFAEESRIAASIEHPNVVPIYAAGEEAGVPYIAMRYVSGSDLGKRLAREGRLAPGEAAALISQIGNGLDAIHAAGLVHRDVKPANVLLAGGAGEDHAYITDFGVARNVATNSGLTQTGRFVGTLDYVAPEQISGGEVDARADVYALGCLLFKLLTAEVPFPKDGEAARLYAHLNDPPSAPSLYAPGVPMALDDVVIRAMSKAADDRYPSAGDLGRAAVAALSGEQPALPERTVATGAAATRTAETILPATEPMSRGKSADGSEVRAGPGRRRLLALAGGVAGVAAIVAAAIALGGGGGDPEGSAANAGQQSTGSREKPKTEPAPDPLGKAELVRRADAICEASQGKYKGVRDGEKEGVPDVPYSKALVEISSPAVKEFRSLDPPAGIRDEFIAYVKAQEEVNRWDEDALRAARDGDEAAYLEARASRDATQAERKELAEAVGLEVCSGSDL